MKTAHKADRQDCMSDKRRIAIPDAVGLILLGISFYLVFDSTRYIYASLVVFLAGLMSLSLERRSHHSASIGALARHIYTIAPTAVILTLVAAALSGFGSNFTRADFGMFYASGLQLRTDPAHLYDVEVQNQVLASVTGNLEYHYLSFPYPPFVAALFVPLSYVRFRDAYYIMLAANVILLATAIYILSRSLFAKKHQVLTIVLAASVLLPVYINIILGQLAFVGLLLYSLFVVDVLDKRTTRAGLWIAFLSFKLALVPIPLCVLLVKRAWKGLGLAVAVFASLMGLSLLLVGPGGMWANFDVMATMADKSLIPRMQSLRALAYYLGLPDWIYLLVTATIVGALWFVDRRGGEPHWMLGAAVLANLAVSPYVQSYDLSLALVAIALAIATFPEMPDSKRTAVLLMVFVPGFLGVAGLVTGKDWPVVPVTVLLLFCWFLYRAAVNRQKSMPLCAESPLKS